ncbi:DUF254-domain-containing protein [Suhomyces tanzawaensis NRRL Y-17324]|uniref:Vacuolar fusion protein MON1 n=1 Tax=Suhomyces tanzawaensis NRRL Y-17324 TaxID=984487 RepID=A0A1E4SKJ7_9ASCO|nr:DUF254-domain-containing protein [Suhomyces tanzawaensis NRRL Y-17324]ODV79952.1 DUF254-domain-containing protein [Suhomyces tanzawaensis NRRL Y-17324]
MISGYSSDENVEELNDHSTTQDEEDLHNILNDLIGHEHREVESTPLDFLELNIFKNEEGSQHDSDTNSILAEESAKLFFDRYIQIDKGNDEPLFHSKLKHFFILSSAGKPVYSMNGSDDIIIGYMGIITTIISTFEENMQEDIKSITVGEDVKIVALTKHELIFVAITKIGYESMSSSNNHEEDSILVNQLNNLYHYLLSILSRPTLEKNFHNRMNYDLRKVLTPLDFHNLDSLCFKMTYGLQPHGSDPIGFDYFMSQLLGSSLQNIKMTNTTRTQLNNILLSSKKLKEDKKESDKLSSFFNIKRDDEEKYIAEDLLFSFLAVSSKILSYLKPKNHNLSNEDISLLISMIESTELHEPDSGEGDLWMPLCMPQFNQNGFLYVFVKKFMLSDYIDTGHQKQCPPITIILISGNKNSFFEMQEISKYIIRKLLKHESFKLKLYKELLLSTKLSVLHDIKVPVIKHFVYKLTKTNQYIMSDIAHYNGERNINSCIQLVYFYSMLRNTKVTKVFKPQGSHKIMHPFSNKKLTYSKWNNVTGFMLCDDTFEFYCLCTEGVDSKDLISHSLKVIKWCEKNYKRLFIGNGVSF